VLIVVLTSRFVRMRSQIPVPIAIAIRTTMTTSTGTTTAVDDCDWGAFRAHCLAAHGVVRVDGFCMSTCGGSLVPFLDQTFRNRHEPDALWTRFSDSSALCAFLSGEFLLHIVIIFHIIVISPHRSSRIAPCNSSLASRVAYVASSNQSFTS
jgi:hypothetical protein